MVFEVRKKIRQRLTEVIDDLRAAVGQQAAKAYLTHVSVEPMELEIS